MHDNLNDEEKEHLKKDDNKRKKEKRDERGSIFDNVQMFCMTDPCILTIPAFRLIEEDIKGAIQEGCTYICNFGGENPNFKEMLLN